MAIKSKVGLEAEFLLFNGKDTLLIPPSYWDRDAFPLLAEIRGKEAEEWPEAVSNFMTKQMEITSKLRKGHTMQMLDIFKVPLKTYKEANRQIDYEDKENSIGQIKNVYGLDISDYSDQVVKGNKIQGINISCGLHIHFSCGETVTWEYDKDEYELVTLPLSLNGLEVDAADAAGLRELINPRLTLYNRTGYKTEKTITVTASRLNKPAIEWIVRSMDEAFFKRFAPEEKNRTKYRQAGFYELKPYGFEYRSLPANDETMAALPEITKKAFDLLSEANSY